MKKSLFRPKIVIPLQIGVIISGLLLASFGVLIYSNNSDKTVPLAVLIFSLCIISLGLWGIRSVKIEGDILEQSNFLGLIKRRRNLRNLTFIKDSRKQIYHHPGFGWLLIEPFFNNKKYSNYRYLTLKFKGEKEFVIDGQGMKRKDFKRIIALLRNSHSKNRKRIRKQKSKKNN